MYGDTVLLLLFCVCARQSVSRRIHLVIECFLRRVQIELLVVKEALQPAAAAARATAQHDEETVIRVYEGLAAAQQALSLESGSGAASGGGREQEDSAESLREAAEKAMEAGSAVFAYPGSAHLIGISQALKSMKNTGYRAVDVVGYEANRLHLYSWNASCFSLHGDHCELREFCQDIANYRG